MYMSDFLQLVLNDDSGNVFDIVTHLLESE